ncbi:N-terminal double-transmembrane domain-containing protein [Maribacter orientalis]|uniref:N-terminal double-transmembrane domain-containing protein n=1 Tax=Maribacter orientalis TaxID=228957 RepID=A0A1H7SUX5_9FLAO|nr:BatA domain-containing protein [Maribacter orientalis]SEL76215.1 N-terminal double-transmembrane domain-containing protein [Maribacter orientalis]
MQFKYPEILWGLLLLLIPILIHLFQLRRFKKTPFTNVKFLKQVISESRKSSTLKKWLLLLARLGFLAALIIAFAQPFIANESALQEKETVFYLDDSFSMNGQVENGNFFGNTIQEFIKAVPKNQRFTLFTNNQVFKDVEIKDIQNDLLNLNVTSEQLGVAEIVLKGNTYFSNEDGIQKNLVLISDFQQRMGTIQKVDSISNVNITFIKPSNNKITNTSIDSIFIGDRTNETIELVTQLSTNSSEQTIPISLYNEDVLIAKTAAKFNDTKKAEVRFTVNANDVILGKVALTDTGLDYDNQFYFNLDKKSKIKVLVISNSSTDFLKRIYLNDEFALTISTLEQLNYSAIDNQDLIIFNEIQKIPNSLITAIKSFSTNGGSYVLIPAVDGDLNSYNELATLNNSRYINAVVQDMAISTIKMEHPLFANVFDKKVADFQFPTVKEHFKIISKAPIAIEFQNKEPFLISSNNAYFFAASINSDNSNFKNSPLIVPTFYNMGINSLKLLPLYASLGNQVEIELPISLQQDDVIKIANEKNEFIPQQRVLPKKVQVNFIENPKEAGIYRIMHNDNSIRHISFNDNRKESQLLYSQIPEEKNNSSLSDFFMESQKNNAINEFWKWFAILALAFVLIETLLQRFLK